jgi:hypothetical protein
MLLNVRLAHLQTQPHSIVIPVQSIVQLAIYCQPTAPPAAHHTFITMDLA